MSVTKQEAGDKPTAMNGFAKRVSSSPASDKLSPQEEKAPLFPFPGKNNIQVTCLQGRQPGTPLRPACGTPQRPGFLTIYMGKSRNSGCKIKWFAPFCLNWEASEKIYGLCFEVMQFFHLFQLDILLVVDCPPTMSNFIV